MQPRQDHLVQRQIRHGSSEPGILSLQLFQPFELIATHAATLFAPPIVGLNRDTDLSHSLLNRFALPLQHLNLSQLQHGFLGLFSLASHFVVLLKTG